MKTWIGINNNYIELGLLDIVKLLLGRELRPQLPGELIIRNRRAYEAFNLAATPQHPETDASLRERVIAAMPPGHFPTKGGNARVHTAIGEELDKIAALYGLKRRRR